MRDGYSGDEQDRVRAAVAPFPDWRIEFEGRVPSTQDACRARAGAGSCDHLCVVASHQTEARGTHGRVWVQEPGRDVTFSVLLEPRGRYPDLLLPLLFGAATWRTVRALAGRPVRIDWPNDVVAGGRKLAGVLIEGRPPASWICGIGLNVNRAAFRGELATRATSLMLLAGHHFDRAAVLRELLGDVVQLVAAAEGGDASESVESFNTGLGLAGREVRVRTGTREAAGRLVRVGPDGLLLAGRPAIPLGEVTALAARP